VPKSTRAPVEHPSNPKTPVPESACDCHAHLYGSPDEYPLAPDRSFDPAPGSLTHYLERYLALHAALGISRGVLVHSNAYGTDNSVTADALAKLGPGYCGVALIDPSVSNKELEFLRQQGMKGVRLNLVAPEPFTLSTLQARAPELADLGFHVEIIMKCADLPEIADDLGSLPLDVVIDHHGLPDTAAGIEAPGFRALLRLLGEDKIWVKASAQYRFSKTGRPFTDTEAFTASLVATNHRRVLWGADWPHVLFDGPMPDEGDLFDQFASVVGNPSMLESILVDNPGRLYGI
jgi:predicted TIM-barrel fold metal-dependent hydrolase